MNLKLTTLCLLTAGAAYLPAQTTAPAPATPAPAAAAPAAPTSPVSTPAMSGPLAVNVHPTSLSVDGSSIYISGAVSGYFQTQNYGFPGEKHTQFDVSNAQVFVQKVDGVFQFFGQFGSYSLPDLGLPYFRAGDLDSQLFGFF